MKLYIASFLLVFISCNIVDAVDQQMIIIMEENSSLEKIDDYVFLSKGERPFGAMCWQLVYAIADGKTPILVHAGTWNIFYKFSQLYSDFTTLLPSQIKQKLHTKERVDEKVIEELQKIFKKFVSKEISVFFSVSDRFTSIVISYYLYRELQDKNKWEYYHINDQFLLLIPKSYVKYIQKVDQSRRFASIKEIVGLNLPGPLKNLSNFTLSFKRKEGDFVKTLQQLFVPTRTSKDEYKEGLDQWYFLLYGHGSRVSSGGSFIASISSSEFVSFLKFLNTKIVTKFLGYSTCYAGGEHLFLPYEERIRGKYFLESPVYYRSLTFNYTILAETYAYATTAVLTESWPYGLTNFKRSELNKHKYNEFFTSVADMLPGGLIWRKTKHKDAFLEEWVSIYQHITHADVQKSLHIPIIRFAGAEWFTLLNPGNKVFYLTKTMLDVHNSENKPVVIPAHKSIIQLPAVRYVGRRDQPTREQRLEILPVMQIAQLTDKQKRILKKTNRDEIIAFISLVPYDVFYAFKELNAAGSSFSSIIKAFLVSHAQEYPRTFYIKKLLVNAGSNAEAPKAEGKDIFPLNQAIAISNVWIKINQKEGSRVLSSLYFEHQGKKYVYKMDKDDTNSYAKIRAINAFECKSTVLDKPAEYTFKNPQPLQQVIKVVKQKKDKPVKVQNSGELEVLYEQLRTYLRNIDKSIIS